ncbi:MAG TPA: alpha/beta fold hydrolase, partial [Candidatus Dormibacteraeota bacterium]
MSRPPYRGVTIDGLNRAVRSFAASTSTARLVDWRSAAVANPRLINPDGVHPTPAGYQLRARLFAQAIRSCSGSAPPVGGGAPSSGGLPPAGTPTPPGLKPTPAPRPRRGHGRSKKPKPAPKKPRKPPPRLGSESPVLIDQPLSFRSSGARLAGELVAPAGSGRHPAVVMIQGSGASTREPYREQAEFLAEHGVAALIYDKRGSGDSTGDPDYRFSQLADDARAAIAALRARPEVQPDGVGLWGLSEGGSVAPLVAAGNPEVKAVMVVSASALPPASQQEWSVRHSLEAAGAGTGSAPVSRYYAVASDLGVSNLRFDPVEAWKRVSQPVLAVWGAADNLVPAHDSASALASALEAGGANHDRLFRTFPGATHVLGVAAESNRPGSAPGFKELSASWLRSHLGGARPAAATVSTPLPPRADVPVLPVQRASALERWPVQLGWLLLPALALVFAATRAWRRRRDGPSGQPPWWWLAGLVGLDLLALGALALAVAAIVGVDGQGVEAVAGVPVLVLLAWLAALAGVAATAVIARHAWRDGGGLTRTVCLASA